MSLMFYFRWKMKKLLIKNLIISFCVLCLASCSNGYAETRVQNLKDCSLSHFYGFKENCRIVNEIDSSAHNFRKLGQEIIGSSTEGGSLEALLDNEKIKKISVTHYGEMGRRDFEVFFKNEKAVFVSEETIYYDRPIYIEGFKEDSKTLLYYIFKNGGFWKVTPGQGKQPKKVLQDVEQAIRDEINAYIKLVANNNSN